MQSEFDVVVIGGGAAGIIAADTAAIKGAKVLLLEKMEKPCRKLRITGKGRCNITNIIPRDEFLKKIYPNADFFKPAFGSFSNTDLIAYLNKIGLETITERGGRVFPASQKAWDVADALVNSAIKNGVTIICKAKVTSLETENNVITKCYYQNNEQSYAVQAKAFIVATGGLSYPATGSTGDGYEWALQTGHKIVNQRPSLVGLESQIPPYLNKLSLRNINITLIIDGGIVQSEFGEAEFTEYGITGPTVLRISRKAVDAIIANKKVKVKIDLKPALTTNQLKLRIDRDIKESKKFGDIYTGLVPSQLCNYFAEKVQPSSKSLTAIAQSDKNNIISILKNFDLNITNYRPFTEAIITAGGISLKDLNRKTYRSKIVDNLFFAGEIIDLDADTGGYNLQIAFSTGWLAGSSATQ